jgi:hypothetical protein
MDPLTAFGAASVGAMLLFYALEDRWRWSLLAFAVACWSASAYALLAGTWPFALVEVIWGGVAVQRFVHRKSRR